MKKLEKMTEQDIKEMVRQGAKELSLEELKAATGGAGGDWEHVPGMDDRWVYHHGHMMYKCGQNNSKSAYVCHTCVEAYFFDENGNEISQEEYNRG